MHERVELWIAVAWPIFSAVVNALFRFKTPEQWMVFAMERPRLAALIRFCSATGLDVHKALNALKDATGKAER
jgi:hypothetical protein